MKRQWTADHLVEHWTLSPDDQALLANRAPATRLGFALLLKYFQHEHTSSGHRGLGYFRYTVFARFGLSCKAK